MRAAKRCQARASAEAGKGGQLDTENATLWPIDQWLAIIVSSLEPGSPSPL